MKSVVCWFVVLAVSFCVRADPLSIPTIDVDEKAVSADVTSIDVDEKALYSGMLVREDRFVKMLDAELAVKELKTKIEIQENLTATLEEMYTKRLREATKSLPWYESPSFNRWVGFTLGVAFTSLIVYTGSYFVRAID